MNQNKIKMLVLIVGTMGILAFFVTEFFQIRSNYQADLLKIKQCFNNERTTVVEVETSYSHSKVHVTKIKPVFKLKNRFFTGYLPLLDNEPSSKL